MKLPRASSVLCLFALTVAGIGAEPPPAKPTAPADTPKQASPEEIKARLADHLKKKAAEAEAVAKAEKKNLPPPDVAAPVVPPGSPAAKATPPAQEEPTVLPKVEVKRGKITELDQQLAKQNQEIAREKVNTKPTALDETLNSPKVSKALAIFGGQSSDDRANVAKERVAMMEEERDLIEAIAQAKDKDEKAELEKTLADMRAMRRELEESLR